MSRAVSYGQRYADSIGTIWEVVDLPDDGRRVKLWNRSYNAFQTIPVEEISQMRKA